VERPRYRYRARFTKSGRLRFIGHLDLTRLLLRALRRAGVELVYSEGFNPKPRVGFAPALPVGITSEAEYMDLEAHARLESSEVLEKINAKLPKDVRFLALQEIPRSLPALGEVICAARYRLAGHDDFDLPRALSDFRDRSPIEVTRTRERKVRTFRLDDEILELGSNPDGSLCLTLAIHGDGASVRPDEVLQELVGDRRSQLRLSREELLVDWNGRLVNPMLAAGAACRVGAA
jgi:radical SAM-linked protein